MGRDLFKHALGVGDGAPQATKDATIPLARFRYLLAILHLLLLARTLLVVTGLGTDKYILHALTI